MSNSPYSLSSFLSAVNNNFLIIVIAVAVFIGGFFMGSIFTENQMLKAGGTNTNNQAALADPNAQPPQDLGPTAEQLAAVPEVGDADHIRGNKNAKILLVEYSDFECPFCARFHPTMQSVLEEYGDDVAWVYRHYPLPFHPNAQKAAEGSECVNEALGGDAFWTYADALSDATNTAGQLSEQALIDAAVKAGMSESAFSECLDSGRMADKVNEQMEAGSSVGVNGTPGTFVVTKDGAQELIGGALPLESVKATVEKYL